MRFKDRVDTESVLVATIEVNRKVWTLIEGTNRSTTSLLVQPDGTIVNLGFGREWNGAPMHEIAADIRRAMEKVNGR